MSRWDTHLDYIRKICVDKENPDAYSGVNRAMAERTALDIRISRHTFTTRTSQSGWHTQREEEGVAGRGVSGFEGGSAVHRPSVLRTSAFIPQGGDKAYREKFPNVMMGWKSKKHDYVTTAMTATRSGFDTA